ncbi:MAG: hypothetical protein ACO1NV_00150 [Leptospira bouyouniensis]|uniref:Lipoprotein n=1 Tax=Leptospira bouyouniensis TaxID=2484911 RepID=A0A7I0HPB6_9LEPT|nr:hypothetical protein [Leptospira bouyouniensis]TGK47124.1 hypothetical protein EHQ10_17555 [Leptospira bouyouniensis]TGL03303.1 hypothetical protein EHQ43_16120 [Leptospira bouyouniensis]TGM80230.1 hypothetical protein EHQ99_11090 [Leptospira bouyouniensis]
MKFLKPIMIFTVLFSLGNCAELFSSKEDNNNDQVILALLAGTRCPSTTVTTPTNGTRFDFANCSGDANLALSGSGFQASNVTLSGGLVGTSNNSTIVTNASSLSNSGGNKKASIEIVYQLNAASSSISAILPSTTSFAGPGFSLLPTTAQKLVDGTASAFGGAAATWGSSVGQDKTLCLEVHQEGAGAHIFGWQGACSTIDRGSYNFEEEDVVVSLGGDRIALRINGATIKSLTIYNQSIGTAGSFQ